MHQLHEATAPLPTIGSAGRFPSSTWPSMRCSAKRIALDENVRRRSSHLHTCRCVSARIHQIPSNGLDDMGVARKKSKNFKFFLSLETSDFVRSEQTGDARRDGTRRAIASAVSTRVRAKARHHTGPTRPTTWKTTLARLDRRTVTRKRAGVAPIRCRFPLPPHVENRRFSRELLHFSPKMLLHVRGGVRRRLSAHDGPVVRRRNDV